MVSRTTLTPSRTLQLTIETMTILITTSIPSSQSKPFRHLPTSTLFRSVYSYFSIRLSVRNNIMVADWDTPVKQYKETRNSSIFPPAAPVNVDDTSVQNSQYASTITSSNTVLKQVIRRAISQTYFHLFTFYM